MAAAAATVGLAVLAAPPAQAAPIRECGNYTGRYFQFVNLTTPTSFASVRVPEPRALSRVPQRDSGRRVRRSVVVLSSFV